eukprot:g88.t1
MTTPTEFRLARVLRENPAARVSDCKPEESPQLLSQKGGSASASRGKAKTQSALHDVKVLRGFSVTDANGEYVSLEQRGDHTTILEPARAREIVAAFGQGNFYLQRSPPEDYFLCYRWSPETVFEQHLLTADRLCDGIIPHDLKIPRRATSDRTLSPNVVARARFRDRLLQRAGNGRRSEAFDDGVQLALRPDQVLGGLPYGWYVYRRRDLDRVLAEVTGKGFLNNFGLGGFEARGEKNNASSGAASSKAKPTGTARDQSRGTSEKGGGGRKDWSQRGLSEQSYWSELQREVGVLPVDPKPQKEKSKEARPVCARTLCDSLAHAKAEGEAPAFDILQPADAVAVQLRGTRALAESKWCEYIPQELIRNFIGMGFWNEALNGLWLRQSARVPKEAEKRRLHTEDYRSSRYVKVFEVEGEEVQKGPTAKVATHKAKGGPSKTYRLQEWRSGPMYSALHRGIQHALCLFCRASPRSPLELVAYHDATGWKELAWDKSTTRRVFVENRCVRILDEVTKEKECQQLDEINPAAVTMMEEETDPNGRSAKTKDERMRSFRSGRVYKTKRLDMGVYGERGDYLSADEQSGNDGEEGARPSKKRKLG